MQSCWIANLTAVDHKMRQHSKPRPGYTTTAAIVANTLENVGAHHL